MAASLTMTAAAVRLKSLFNDPLYKEALEHTASYNTRVCIERKMRLPFLDAQTGVAQNNCYLWMTKYQRMPGQCFGQLYSYPARRWRKKRRAFLTQELNITRVGEVDINESADIHQISTVENPAVKVEDIDKEGPDKASDDNSKDQWYRDMENISEPPDAGEIEDPDSDLDDYEETYTRRRKKKAVTRASKRKEKAEPIPDELKPYSCDVCGARYKTRPGLTYHYTHSHNGPTDPPDDENAEPSPKAPTVAVNDPLAGRRGTRRKK